MQPSSYTVKAGDSVSKIAKQYGVPISAVSGYRSGNANVIQPGEKLLINAPASSTPANTISSSNLGGTPFVTPTPPVPVAATGLMGLVQSTQNNIANLQPKVDKGEQDITETFNLLGGQSKKKQDLYESEGVNTARKEIDEINNKMDERNMFYERQIEQIEKNNPEGKLVSGLNYQVKDLRRDQARELADLAIVANAKQGNYTTAKSIVDARITAETEDLNTRLDGLKFFYDKNYSTLTNAQKTLLDQQTQVVQNELEDKRTLLTQIGDLQIEAAKNRAPVSVIQQLGQAKDLSSAISAAAPYLGDKLDEMYKTLQIQKLQQEISGSGSGQDASDILAFAQQYASTGTIPTGMPKGTFGLVSQVAKELPKPAGTVVDANTGIKSGKLNETQMSGITALYDISQKVQQLKELDEGRMKGIIPGTLGYIFGSDAQSKYTSTRQEIIDLLARARTGAALTTSEETFYKSQLPSRFSDPVFGLFGANSDTRINSFDKKINDSLNAKLANNGLSIYGFSSVDLGGQKAKVGDILTNSAGQSGRVNPDGSITLIQ